METPHDEKLYTVHDAVDDAVAIAAEEKKRDTIPMVQCSFRVSQDLKDKADEILKARGTTQSAYLRACVQGLVRDYLFSGESNDD